MLKLIEGGENSGVEFKRDDISPVDLATVLVAFANLRGGDLLLGVEDDGSVSGINREYSEVIEWATNICRDKVRPPLAPYFEICGGLNGSNTVVRITVPASKNVHSVWHNNKLNHVIRVGSQNRDASTEELARLLQKRKTIRFDKQPVPDAALDDLDRRRLRHYFCEMRGLDEPESEDAWISLLNNAKILEEETVSSGGMVLFGDDPSSFLPQAEIIAAAYRGTEKDYEYQENTALSGAMVPYFSGNKLQEAGLVEQSLYFFRRNTRSPAEIVDGRRIETPEYPEKVLREALVNALVHRDYFLVNSNIELNVYSDRIEIVTPGELPNGITPEKMKNGARATRNPMILFVMRDYGYIERLGMGLPKIIVKGMIEHNGTEPELVVQDERFILRLFSGK